MSTGFKFSWNKLCNAFWMFTTIDCFVFGIKVSDKISERSMSNPWTCLDKTYRNIHVFNTVSINSIQTSLRFWYFVQSFQLRPHHFVYPLTSWWANRFQFHAGLLLKRFVPGVSDLIFWKDIGPQPSFCKYDNSGSIQKVVLSWRSSQWD
jgi:hypothetical protein